VNPKRCGVDRLEGEEWGFKFYCPSRGRPDIKIQIQNLSQTFKKVSVASYSWSTGGVFLLGSLASMKTCLAI